MEKSSLKERTVALYSSLRHTLPRLKRTQLYGLAIALLLLAAFVAGGIFLQSASAAGKGGNATKQANDGQQWRKDVFTVTAINGTTITGKHNDGSTITVVTNAETKFSKDDAPSSLSAVAIGATIGVAGPLNGDGSLTAAEVILDVSYNPAGDPKGKPADDAVGRITAIQGTTLTLQTQDATLTVTTSPTTAFGDKEYGKKITLSDLQVGDAVIVAGKREGTSFSATFVVLVPQSVLDNKGQHNK